MTRGPARLAVLLLAASVLAAVSSAQANQGVIFSEIVFGPSLPPVGGNPMPSYIELVNVEIANPVVPPPVPIGSGPNQASITASVNGQSPVTFLIPLTGTTQGSLTVPPVTVPTMLGGNVQPSPATPPPTTPAQPPVLLISSSLNPFPLGSGVPANVIVIHAPVLFSGPNSQLGAPGVPFDLCFNNPATGRSDKIHLGPGPVVTCGGGAAPVNTNTFVPSTGRASRWCYMDSNTDIDFDPVFQHSPGLVNPEMVHVNGFFFGTTASTASQGTPLNISGSQTSGQFFFPSTARVKSVNFHKPGVITRSIANPAFDPIINAQVFMTSTFTAQSPSISQPGFLPGLQITSELMQIPMGAGMLNMPMNLSSLVGANVAQTTATNIRVERIFSDLVTDAAAFITGSGTAAAADVIPPSAGDGNQWCEIIVFDYQGNEYRAKVKNWPQGSCGGPLLALGTDGAGSCTILNLCFGANASIANLFSLSPPTGCPVGLLPPNGICPDAITNWVLTPPQFGSPPFFAMTDMAGIFLYQVPTGTLLPFVGMTFHAVGVEYIPPATLVQQSPATTITF